MGVGVQTTETRTPTPSRKYKEVHELSLSKPKRPQPQQHNPTPTPKAQPEDRAAGLKPATKKPHLLQGGIRQVVRQHVHPPPQHRRRPHKRKLRRRPRARVAGQGPARRQRVPPLVQALVEGEVGQLQVGFGVEGVGVGAGGVVLWFVGRGFKGR
jgi:hypothetical protein